MAGRPVDFSGAVGGPFEVRYEVNTNSATPGDRFMISILIIGSGDLSHLKPPDLQGFGNLNDQVVVDEVLVQPLVTKPGIAFDYKVRAKKPGFQQMIPRWKFVYFNPVIHDWQTTYAESTTFGIESPMLRRGAIIDDSPELKKWCQSVDKEALREYPGPTTWFEYMVGQAWDYLRANQPKGRSGAPALWVVPAAISGVVIAVYGRRRRRGPARLMQNALKSLEDLDNIATSQIRDSVLRFLSDQFGCPDTNQTPNEVREYLGRRSPLVNVLEECDFQRYSGVAGTQGQLLNQARIAVNDWKR
jgi:hypothetical protein